jgi:hypothetical protein
MTNVGARVGVMRPIEQAEISTPCAGCGAETTTPERWMRLHGTLLCPDCHAALVPRSGEVGRNLARADREWERLWRRVGGGLDSAA